MTYKNKAHHSCKTYVKHVKTILYKANIFAPEASAVMVGDREHDMIGAKRNHIPAIGVLFGYGSREELSEAGAWELAETVDDLYLHLTGEVYQGGAL